MKKSNNQGFTLGELLIVVAIIGVLSATSIPLFTAQLEKAKQSADLANMRSAKVAAIADYLYEGFGSEYRKYFNAGSGTMSDEIPEGYGRSSKNAEEFASELNATGVPNKEGNANYITVEIDKDGQVSMMWGTSSFFSLWKKIDYTTVEDEGWWNNTDARRKGFANLINSDNEARKKADKEILNAIADYFNGMKASDVKDILGTKKYNTIVDNKDGKARLFEYNIDGSGSIRINGFDTTNQPYLSDLGYTPRIYSNKTVIDDYTTSYNYLDHYLFTSNEMVNRSTDPSTGAHKESSNNVQISFKVDDNGNVTDTVIWIDGLSGYTSGD